MKKIVILSFICFASINCFAQAKVEGSLDSIFNSQFKSNEPGGAVLIVKNGKIIYKKGFGVEDIKTKKRITSQSLFNVGSISKTFVAYGILNLAKEGKLSLNDDLGQYFPGFKNPALAKQVKIYNLLTHTSGLPDNRNVDADSVFYLTAKDAENWAPIMQNDTLEFEPGEKWKYSNPAFNGLALIIEKLTKEKWQHYINRLIFKPSGMVHSTITDGAHPEKGVTHGYVLTAAHQFMEKDYGEEPTFCAAGNGGVWSSVEELWKYEQAIEQHIFLDSAWIEKSRTIYPMPNWKDTREPFMGLSWFITGEAENKFIGHTGSQGGFRGDYVWMPNKEIFYVLLCNTPKPIVEIRRAVLDVVEK
ncbi:MAG: serine hydrolase domain-containing protein [Flavisolibacter sp.]|jgi:CubicO group peptidase (beta-lactamase class C family)